MNAFSTEAFRRLPFIGILRGNGKKEIDGIMRIYGASGLTTIEITLNTPNALEILREMVSRYGGQLNIGAGTICTEDDLNNALEAGAQFIVTPILDVSLIRRCKTLGVPIFAGAFTPTEIYQAWSAGATMVKVFPAAQLGPGYLAQLKGPLNAIKLLPTGGINLNNMKEFMDAGADGFGLGSSLMEKRYIAAKNWTGLQRHFERYVTFWEKKG